MPKMTGSRLFAEMMQGYGITHVFYVPTILRQALNEMDTLSIKRVQTHGEKAAAYMADGYARAANRPGLCMAQAIGGSNLAAGLRDPYMAGSPVVAVTGGPTPQGRYKYAYQEIEDFPQFDAVTKFNACIDTLPRMPDLIRQAFREATSGAPGPVHVQIQNRGGTLTEQEGELDSGVEPGFGRVPAFRPEPEMQRVRDAAAALAGAKRPLIVAGGGVVRSGAEREVVELAEKMQIPVVTSLNAKATILDSHPLSVGVSGSYSRYCANNALLEADLVFFIGSHTAGQLTHNWRFPPVGTPVIQLDISPAELGRNYRNRVSLLGDAKVTLQRLIEAAPKKPPEDASAWTGRVQQLVAEWRAEEEPHRNSDAFPMRAERICKEITDALPPDGVVVADTASNSAWSANMIDFKYPAQRYIRCAGSLGWGFPGALGVKCALPDRPVLCFTGDAGFYYHIAELETARRCGINAVILVHDNNAINPELAPTDGSPPRGADKWRYSEVNFARIAEEFGCIGMRVERPAELRDALQRAFAMNRPVVIDAISDVLVKPKRPAGGLGPGPG